MHDFAIPELGKAVPYGIYDVSANAGFVNVGISADTGEFSVASIRRWWYAVGAPRYPDAKKMLINADCGGSNGARLRLWKRELQVLADELGIEITVCHVPPGTSKWNKIEHRLFSFITQNWRGKPLVSHKVIIQLIAATSTGKGLTVTCDLDRSRYPTRYQNLQNRIGRYQHRAPLLPRRMELYHRATAARWMMWLFRLRP